LLIYLVTNTVNGKRYVGQTTKTKEQRWQGHVNSAYRTDYINQHFAASIRKHGKEAFIVETLVSDVSSKELLNTLERHFIALYQTQVRTKGYNMMPGGEQPPVFFGAANFMYGKRGKDSPNYGFRHSEDSKLKMALSCIAYPRKIPCWSNNEQRVAETIRRNKSVPTFTTKDTTASEETRKRMRDSWTPEKRRSQGRKHETKDGSA
jgi:group I intron endonuclease